MRLFIRGLVQSKDMAAASLKAADVSNHVLTRWEEGSDPNGYIGMTLYFTGEKSAVARFRQAWKTEMEQRGYHVEID